MEVASENGNTGILKSHGYPQPYLGQQDCQWRIKGRPFHVLHLKFKIDIEYSQCCSHGMLAIKPSAYNFLSTLHNIPDRICGYFDSLELYWDGDFTMQFKTSARTAAANRHTGFRLQYSYVPLQKTSIWDLITIKVSGGYLDHTNFCWPNSRVCNVVKFILHYYIYILTLHNAFCVCIIHNVYGNYYKPINIPYIGHNFLYNRQDVRT